MGSSFTVRIPFGTAHLPRGSIDGQRTQASTAICTMRWLARPAMSAMKPVPQPSCSKAGL